MRRLLLLTALLATACGSTVQVQGQRTLDGGLAQQPQQATTGTDGGTPLGGSGSAVGTSTGAATGGTGSSATGTSGSGLHSAMPGSTGSTGATVPTTPGKALGAHEPIKIGFITTSVGNAESFGFNAGQSYTDKAMVDALVAEYNKEGGVAGHRIDPVIGATDTASSNWENEFNRVCSTFTQDNAVRAVIGYIFVFLPSFEQCLARNGVPHLYGGYQPGDVVNQGKFPTLVATGHPAVDGFLLTALDGAERTGLITKSTKMGIIVDTCADGDRAYERTVVPWLKARKVNYQTAIANCAEGGSDASSVVTTVSNAELRFASSGVNLVFAPGIEMLVFMQQAQSQNYAPEYLGATGGAALQANAPANQLKHFHGFGWMPAVDVDLQHQPYPQTPSQKACIAKLTKHGLRPAAFNDFMTAYQACDGIDLYAKALAAKGTTQASAIVSGVTEAMRAFAGRGTYGGSLQALSHQRGGAAQYRSYAWTDACSCLTYRGPLYPVPNP